MTDDDKVAKEKLAQKHRDELRAEEYKSLSEAIAATINRTNDVVARLQKVEKQLNISSKSENPDAVRYYDVILSESLQSLVSSFAEANDSVLSSLLNSVVNILLGTRELIVLSTNCKKPDQNNLSSLLSPLLSSLSDIQTLSLKHSTSPNAALYTAIATGSQAFSWISSNSPLLHVTNMRSNFSQLKSNLNAFDNQTSSFLAFLCRLEGYLEITYKQGISWKGNQDIPSQLHWNFHGTQLFPSTVVGQTSKIFKICDSLSGGKDEVIEVADQRILVLNSQESVLTIKGSNIPLVSIENCSFTTIKIQADIACLDLSHCQFVRVECAKFVGGINIERCKSCTLEVNNTIQYDEINLSACLDIKILQTTVEEPICNLTSVSKTAVNFKNGGDSVITSHINDAS